MDAPPSSAPFTVQNRRRTSRSGRAGAADVPPDVKLAAADRARIDGLAPLSAAELRDYQHQREDLAAHGRVNRAAEEGAYPFGDALLRARDTRFWCLDGRRYTSFFAYAEDITGVKRDTLRRLLQLAEYLSAAEYQDLIARGASHAVLQEMFSAPPAFKPVLLALAPGLTAGDMAAAVAAAHAHIHPEPDPPDPMDLVPEIKDAVAKARQGREGKCSRCGQHKTGRASPPAPPPPPVATPCEACDDLRRELAEARARLESAQQAAPAPPDNPLDALCTALQQEVAALKADPATQAAALAAERAQLADARAVHDDHVAYLHQEHLRLLQLDQDTALRVEERRRELAAIEARLATAQSALAQADRDLDDRVAITQALEQHITEQQGHLQELTEREQRADQKEAHCARIIADHLRIEQELELLRGQLTGKAHDIEDRQQALKKTEIAFAAYVDGLFSLTRARWDDNPYCVTTGLIMIHDLLDRVRQVALWTREQVAQEREIVDEEYFPYLIKIGERVTGLREYLCCDVLLEHLNEFVYQNGEAAARRAHQRHLLEQEAAARAPYEARPHKPDPREVRLPALSPSLPTRALLNTANPRLPQYGLWGLSADLKAGYLINANEASCGGIAGIYGAGKTTALQTAAEIHLADRRGLSHTPKPAAVLWPHTGSGTLAYTPGILAAKDPNREPHALSFLAELGAPPKGLSRIRVFIPPMEAAAQAARQAFYRERGHECHLFRPSLRSLNMHVLLAIFGVTGPDIPQYLMRFLDLLRELPLHASLDDLWRKVLAAGFNHNDLKRIEARFGFLRRYVGDDDIRAILAEAGVLSVLDLCAPGMTAEEAQMLAFMGRELMIAEPGPDGRRDLRLVIWDEGQKFFGRGSVIVAPFVMRQQEQRHLAVSDLIGVPGFHLLDPRVRANLTWSVGMRLRSRAAIKAMTEVNAGYAAISEKEWGALEDTWGYLMTDRSSNGEGTSEPLKIKLRPPASMPGGQTRAMVNEDEDPADQD